MGNKILVVTPHPDDETLGCGGTLLKHKRNGDQIYWMIVTNIHTGSRWPQEKVDQRQKEIEKVSKMYGFAKTFKLDFPTTELEQVSMADIVLAMSKAVADVKPHTVYLPNRSDIHTDHQIIFKAALSCTKSFRYPFIKRVLMYEVPSETEFAPALPEAGFIPNAFVDITPYFEKKMNIMKVYKSEVMREPLPRSLGSIKALAQVRGSRIGKKYAEAFMLIQEIL